MRRALFLCLAIGLAGGPALAQSSLYVDVTASSLPALGLTGPSMDALAVDVDADGDLDLLVACEFCANILLINDGSGHFADESADRLPRVIHDTESLAAADFDGDGDLDIVAVSEDDRTDALYLNDGTGHFADGSDRLPVVSITNAVLAADLNGDGAPDIVLGDNGQDHILINDRTGHFVDETAKRLPAVEDVTQDLALGDVDGDGDLDLVLANEAVDRLLVNDGAGVFTESAGAFDVADESRKVSLGDVDGDGDLDVFFANVALSLRTDPTDRLWINDGAGHFTDESASRIPADIDNDFHGALVDIDADGDLDIVSAVTGSLAAPSGIPMRVFLNDGTGRLVEAFTLLPVTALGNGFDIEFADFNGDGQTDFYLAIRWGQDRLFLHR